MFPAGAKPSGRPCYCPLAALVCKGRGPSWFCTLTGYTQAVVGQVCAMAPRKVDRRLAWPLEPKGCVRGLL